MSTLSDKTKGQNSSQEPPKKPDLRQAGKNVATRNMIFATCVLVVIYMYPMIFRPMFGIDSSTNEAEQKLEETKDRIAKHRPSFMPEWSSPFGPKPTDQ